jgi:flagellar biosynthesis protein FliP
MSLHDFITRSPGPGTRRCLLLATFALGLGLGLCWGDPAFAQSLNLDMGVKDGQFTSRTLQLAALVTVLSMAPSILMVVTSFSRIIIVLSLLRTALGTSMTPPNTVLIGLALFLTAFIMTPTFEQAYRDGVAPLAAGDIDETQAFERTIAPFKTFMVAHTRDKDLIQFFEIAKTPVPNDRSAAPIQIVVPAFIISELRRAFEIGFLLFVPFLVIDLVVASILMGMGMMMLPPITISLPFKLIFFVLVDGWSLVSGSLVQSFGGG